MVTKKNTKSNGFTRLWNLIPIYLRRRTRGKRRLKGFKTVVVWMRMFLYSLRYLNTWSLVLLGARLMSMTLGAGFEVAKSHTVQSLYFVFEFQMPAHSFAPAAMPAVSLPTVMDSNTLEPYTRICIHSFFFTLPSLGYFITATEKWLIQRQQKMPMASHMLDWQGARCTLSPFRFTTHFNGPVRKTLPLTLPPCVSAANWQLS